MDTPVTPNVLDINGLAALRRLAHANDPQGIKAAAQQFEALFLQQVMQAMRDATPQDDNFDSDQTRMYQSLLDQQMVQALAAKGNGTGLAAMIEKQLGRQESAPQPYPTGLPLTAPPAQPLSLQPQALPLPSAPPGSGAALPLAPTAPAPAGGTEFMRRIWPHAQAASRATGIPAQFVAAQAALESGWGVSEPRTAAGLPSHNPLGIKAGSSWAGPVAEATTVEVVNGKAQRRVERFRAYGSYAEAFQDYAAILKSNPRFASALAGQDAAAFSRGMQSAGYATDPHYAAKLQRILAGNTFRNAISA
jgi:flagellar protein FlgJ